jgi:hypothetical protein
MIETLKIEAKEVSFLLNIEFRLQVSNYFSG